MDRRTFLKLVPAGAVMLALPKGAASFKDSLLDLSSNGNHMKPVGDVGWTSVDGWIFRGEGYLRPT